MLRPAGQRGSVKCSVVPGAQTVSTLPNWRYMRAWSDVRSGRGPCPPRGGGEGALAASVLAGPAALHPHRCLAADRRAPDGLQQQSKLHPRQTIERVQRLHDEGTTADDYDATEHHPVVRGNPTSD